MKRPLGFVALLYGGGLVLAELFQPPLLFLFSLSFLVAFAALRFTQARTSLLCGLILLAGWTHLTCRTAVISPHDLRTLLGQSAEDIVVRGKLAETPSERIYVRNDTESSRTLAELSLIAIQREGTWQPAHGKVIVVTPGTLPVQFFGGQEVKVSGVIAPPRPPLAEGLFDYRTYLRRQGIYYELKTASARDWTLISADRTPPLSDRFLLWAKATMARGLPTEDKPLRLLWAMTLGSKNVLTREAYDPFVESGTMHIFAISGLHIALIAGILVSLLRVLRVPRSGCGAVVIPLIWFYTAATGWQPSAVRSTLMMSLIIAGWSLKRPTDLLNSLSAAALIILLCDPQQLFQASFQLSFFVVLSIALLLPPLEKLRDRLLRHDPLLPVELIPRWQKWLGQPLRWLATSLATSIAAWLGAWPLTVYYFHLFSPVTLLANLFIVPLSGLALASNLGSLVCGSWFPLATELFNHGAWFLMAVMMKTSELSIQLPGAFFYAPPPTLPDLIFYYALLVAVLSGFVLAANRRRWTVAALTGVTIFYGWRWQEARSTTDLTVIPLNGGSALFCDGPGRGNDLLVDCGNASAVEFVMKPFLQAQGLNRLPRLALTHGDARAMGGTEMLRALMPVEKIVTSSARFRSPVYRQIIRSLEETSGPWQKVSAGHELGHWTVLHPAPTNSFPLADDNALVLRGEISGTSILVLSDLARSGQEFLLEKQAVNLRSDIVIAGLPEKGEPLCDALLDAIQPKLIVIADSEFPASRRASPALRERLRQREIPVLYTREMGAAKITFRRNAWQCRTADGFEMKWRDK
ncbi:MAG: ComEC/Rec2 family competence protein [Akkermansiaceae bacterium]|nr:ComEC/Rec2 family competence protein [Verrucomicrobiales bacterium]